MSLTDLPYELLTYLLKEFIGLDDLWHLSQVSRYLRRESIRVIEEQWEIYFSSCSYSLLKIQFHSAIISLSQISRRLIRRIKIYDPSAFPPLILVDKIEEDSQEIGSFPPTIEPGVDTIENEGGFLMDRLRYHSRRLYHLLTLEDKLNENIFNMIRNQITHSADLESHTKILIDTAIHHAIIIQGRLMRLHSGSLEIYNNCRAFAAVVTRFISRYTKVLPIKSITTYLINGIFRYFEQASYRLLSILPRLSRKFLSQFKRSCVTESSHKCFKNDEHCQFKMGARNYWSFIKGENRYQDAFVLILHGMTASCDLIGASFNAMLLKEMNVRGIILKLINVLSIFGLDDVKKSILTNMKETWFISHVQMPSHDFIAWFQSAIEKGPTI